MSILAAVSPEFPYVARPSTTPIVTRRCACVGGTDPCVRYRELMCGLCGQSWRYCEAGAAALTWGPGGPLHPVCLPSLQAHGRCVECGRTGDRCRCCTTTIGPYHGQRDARGRSAPPGIGEPLVGLECEAVYPGVADLPARIGAACHGLSPIVWAHERDSSLGTDGVETITVPLPVSIWREALPALWGAIADAGGTMGHDSCGGHIHVSATPAAVKGAVLLAESYLIPPQVSVWDAVAGRPTTAYSSIAPQRPLRPGALPAVRAALWSAGRGTIEWRHPAGTDDPRVALGRVELIVDAIAHAAQHATGSPGRPWGWGLYVRDRRDPTPTTYYAWALLRSIGL